MIRGILREFGHILPTGIEAVSKFDREHGSEDQLQMPEIADGVLGASSVAGSVTPSLMDFQLQLGVVLHAIRKMNFQAWTQLK